jgi:hypothetical protein
MASSVNPRKACTATFGEHTGPIKPPPASAILGGLTGKCADTNRLIPDVDVDVESQLVSLSKRRAVWSLLVDMSAIRMKYKPLTKNKVVPIMDILYVNQRTNWK